MRRGFFLLIVGLDLAVMGWAGADMPVNSAPGTIGASLMREVDSGHLLVEHVVTDSPAARAGLKPGDWIEEIDGRSSQGLSADEAKLALRGEIGSVVKLTVRGPGDTRRGLAVARQSAFAIYSPAALAGDPMAQAELGYWYQHGPGGMRDLAKSVEMYRQAAEQGYARAEFALGFMYVNGLVIPPGTEDASKKNPDAIPYADRSIHQDYPTAFAWFTKSAAQDDPKAEYYLGQFYQKGTGVARDDAKAFYWYERSARHDIPYAEWDLAYLYEKGLGVQRNTTEALKWYAKAQVGLPDNDALRKHIAILSLQAFVENPNSVSLDLSLFMTAFRPQFLPFFYALMVVYFAGGIALFYFTFRQGEGAPGLLVSGGWLMFNLEGQAVALIAVFMAGALLTADNMFVATCLFSAVPIILSTLGPNRRRVWRASGLSGRTLLLYGVGGFALIFLVLQGYDWIYTRAMQAALPMQPTAVMIAKAKAGSVWLTYACVAVALPMTEEILFRGYLFEALQRYCPDALVVILTAFGFALVHFQWFYFAPLFGFGLVQGWVKLRTGSLWVPVLLHVLNNGMFLALGS
jgi:membrane protease YdiL (CAAX protease family)/tetratricopeptide (TPR) repeat protein